ncbi:hypothetical protein V0M98_35220 (plasmid) [Pseudomonas silesiensis]|uniref:hypothetical protein n=1 Tax=Pseudomonas silesiensis TaxID=1853130 RepID=UPI0030D515FA
MKCSSLFAALAAVTAALITQHLPAAEAVETEAIKQAASTFNTYIAQCNGKTYSQIKNAEFIEFSGPFVEPELKYAWKLEEHQRLNGVVWAGLFEVNLGQSARVFYEKSRSGLNVEEWQKINTATFMYQLKSGRWEITNSTGRPKSDIDIKLFYWETLLPGTTCAGIPKIPS